MISGIHAIGGIGLITSNILPKSALAVLLHPIRIPKKIPNVHANSSASNTRFRDAHACPRRLILPIGFVKVLPSLSITAAGPGISSG